MRVYLGLGTNLGDKESNLHVAVRKINERIGEVTALSAFYVTAPWGFSSENSFLNAACCVESVLPPLDILRETQEIERELGRMKKSAGEWIILIQHDLELTMHIQWMVEL